MKYNTIFAFVIVLCTTTFTRANGKNNNKDHSPPVCLGYKNKTLAKKRDKVQIKKPLVFGGGFGGSSSRMVI
jgi:hypothetical protein